MPNAVIRAFDYQKLLLTVPEALSIPPLVLIEHLVFLINERFDSLN